MELHRMHSITAMHLKFKHIYFKTKKSLAFERHWTFQLVVKRTRPMMASRGDLRVEQGAGLGGTDAHPA